MYLAKLQTKGFRCLDNFSIAFGPGLNVIVGPNNAGKTAIVEAISLVLSTWGNPAREIYAKPEDFWHSNDGRDKAEREFKITLDLLGVPDESIGVFSDWIVDGEPGRPARISVVGSRSSPDSEKVKLSHGVGERGNASLTEEAIERLRPVFLPPLRDAENQLKPGRRSRLARLVQHIADQTISAEIENRFEKIQDEIINKPPFSTAIERVNERLASASGAFYKQIAHLEFVELEFKRITELLQMRIGLEGMLDYPLTENGLGYNNLLYIATILSQLSKDSDQDLRLLLIEEPEAHLHPQMQQVLVDALMDASAETQPEGEKRSQIIMTSHSPLLAAHVPVDNIIVLHRHEVEPSRLPTDTSRPKKGKPLARNISQFKLDPRIVADLSRYLDSTKANLLFADGIILVEGIAETLLLPLFAKAINRPLNEYHVSIVNVAGLAFGPFLELFNSLDRLQIPCALVTDSDPDFRNGDKYYCTKSQPPLAIYDEDSDDEVDGDEILFPETLPLYGRAHKLEEGAKKTPSGARVFRSLKTFEYDLALTDYLDHMIAAYQDIDAIRGAEIQKAITGETDKRKKAIRFFKQFSPRDKARFAQYLASCLDPLIKKHWTEQESSKGQERTNWDTYLEPPSYISGAIKWVTGDCKWDELK